MYTEKEIHTILSKIKKYVQLIEDGATLTKGEVGLLNIYIRIVTEYTLSKEAFK